MGAHSQPGRSLFGKITDRILGRSDDELPADVAVNYERVSEAIRDMPEDHYTGQTLGQRYRKIGESE